MVYTETRTLNGNKYYYRGVSFRNKNKVQKKRIYLGCNLSNKDIATKEKKADEKLLFEKRKKIKKEIQKIRSKILTVLKKNKVTRAGIFGSYARGEQKEKSDIDIAVQINDDKMSLLGFIKLINILQNILKRKVDLVEYSEIKPIIKETILNEEVRIL